MSVDLISLGRHNLDISSIEKTAQQISERLDINIAIGYWDDGKFIQQQLIERHPGAPVYQMEDCSDEYTPVQYNLDAPPELMKSRSGPFCFMTISLESVYISFWVGPWRWKWYWNIFGDDGQDGDWKSVCEYRKYAKEYYGKLGASYIYCYADQGPSDLIGEYEDGTWEEFENAIRTGKYLDIDYARKEWPEFTAKDLRIINVSDFLTKKNTEPSHSWWDIFYDDFADLS